MSRLPTTHKLPPIAVEDEAVKRSLSIPGDLERDLVLYGEYFQTHSKRKPRSSEDVMVGLITAYLAEDVLFQRWKKDRSPDGEGARPAPQERPSRRASPAAAPAPHLNGSTTPN